MAFSLADFESVFIEKSRELCRGFSDPSHDLLHVFRVVKMAKELQQAEGGELAVILPAAYFHDFVYVAKTDPRRAQASTLSAQACVEYLKSISYPERYLDDIFHAAEAHSFSRNLETRTLEAKIVQDADRLDGLGAVGVLRTFSLGGMTGRAFYSEQDSFADKRVPDDRTYTLDHLYVKLYKVAGTMKTKTAQTLAAKRVDFMKSFENQLKVEI